MICQFLHNFSECHEVRMSHMPRYLEMGVSIMAVNDDQGCVLEILSAFFSDHIQSCA